MIEHFFTELENMLPNIVAALIIFIVGYFASKLVLKLMSKGLNMRHVNTTIHKFSMSVVHVTMLVLVIVMALSALKVPMSSIIAAIGTAGLAIGLALQDSLSNVAGGFIILFSQPFKCGDYIKVDTEEGTVDEISILYTKLMTVENQVVCIPNGSVSKATIVNYTSNEKRRLELKFSISYNDDHRKAMELIREVVNSEERVLHSPDEPLIVMCEHGASAVVLMLRVWLPTENYWEIRFKFIEEVKVKFDENGISIPFNQLDVHINNSND